MKKIILSVLTFISFQSIAGFNQIIVDSTDDIIDEFSGNCTLREAVRNANLNQFSPIDGECEKGSDTLTDVIILSSGETYELSLPNNAGSPDDTGDLDFNHSALVQTDLRIETSGAGQATIRQTVNGQRVLENHGDGVELHNLIISGGSIDGVGGGVLNDEGFITLTSSNVLSNSANAGGGLYNDAGGLRIVDSSVQLNSATFIGGGGVFNTGFAAMLEVDNSLFRGNTGPAGGAIYSNGDTVVVESQSMINLNQATTGNGGAIVNLENSRLLVRDSSFDSNTASDNGGAIYTESSIETEIDDTSFVNHNATQGGAIRSVGVARLTLNSTNFLFNSSASHGGAISATFVTLMQSHLEGNEAFLGNGGAIHATTGADILDNTTITGNIAVDGAGVYVQILELVDSKVENNSASNNGGGIYISNRALVQQAQINENSAVIGGGIYLRDGGISVSEFQGMLVSENMANTDGGGVWLGSDAVIGNSTITLNSASNGGGLYIAEDAEVTAVNMSLVGHLSGQDLHKYGSLTLQNSIISTPGQPDCLMGLNNPAINSLGNNIADDASCFGLTMPTDMINTSPQLEPLADNGGNTMTYALMASSPAINSGNDGACNNDPVFGIDQRGAARPFDGTCDIGAHEQGSLPDIIFANSFE